jgi:hypothetical protein
VVIHFLANFGFDIKLYESIFLNIGFNFEKSLTKVEKDKYMVTRNHTSSFNAQYTAYGLVFGLGLNFN